MERTSGPFFASSVKFQDPLEDLSLLSYSSQVHLLSAGQTYITPRPLSLPTWIGIITATSPTVTTQPDSLATPVTYSLIISPNKFNNIEFLLYLLARFPDQPCLPSRA